MSLDADLPRGIRAMFEGETAIPSGIGCFVVIGSGFSPEPVPVWVLAVGAALIALGASMARGKLEKFDRDTAESERRYEAQKAAQAREEE